MLFLRAETAEALRDGALGRTEVAMTAEAPAVCRVAEVCNQRGHTAGVALRIAADQIKLLAAVIGLGAIGAPPAVRLRAEADQVVICNVDCAMNVKLLNRLFEELGIHAQSSLQLVACDRPGPSSQRLMNAFELVERGVIAFQKELMRAAVRIGMHQDGAAGQAIATGAADLLVVGLKARRKRGVDHGAYI